MKTIIISHESDVDGIFSASIALMRFPQAKTLFTSYGKENFRKISQILYAEVISNPEKGQIIISDLGLNDDMIDLFEEVFSFLKSNLWTVVWVDHHPWSDRAIKSATEKGLVQLFLDKSEKKCATEVMYEKYLKGNSIAEELSKIAHTTDFFTKEQVIPHISELIIYYKTFPDFYVKISKLAGNVAKGILWTTEMQKEYDEFIILCNKAKKETLKNLDNFETKNGIKISLAMTSPYLQISLFSEEVFNETKADVAFFLNEEGKISIRRNNDTLQCNEIAKQLLDGGGHKFAAGGKIKSDPKNKQEVIKELISVVENAPTIKINNDNNNSKTSLQQ